MMGVLPLYCYIAICDSKGIYVLCDLAPFVQFEKHEKHPWRSFTFSKIAG